MIKIAFSPIYKYTLPEGHRFPMLKYELLPEQLLYEGTISESNFFHPKPLDEKIICATHDSAYWQRFRDCALTAKEMRKIGFPLSERLVERCITIADGTIQCALFAQQYGIALNVAGGTHHAFTDRGEGFCMLNDIAIAANYLIDNGLSKRILIIDLDVHQGNGTAQIFGQHRNKWQDTEGGYKKGVFTFSMHGANNYPLHKEVSNLDIGLADGTTDSTYLATLHENLAHLFDIVEPDFAFFNSGVDVLATDKLGRLALSIEGCRQRDRLVFEMCRKNNVPVAVSMGGGYSPRLATIVEAHANTFRMAQYIFG